MSKCVKCGNEILTGDMHWEMGLCNNCYNELYKDHKTHISLDKMWLKLAQDFRDENEKLQDKVADLEAKLAESEKKAYSRGHSQRDIASEIKLNALREDVANKEKRIVELKKQLAEKDLAIENCQTMYESVVQTCHNDKEEIERLNKQLAEKYAEIESYKHTVYMNMLNQEMLELKVATQDQDKISFALEQLEQIINLFEPYENEEKDTILCANNGISFLEYIDNQIKQLKEMK